MQPITYGPLMTEAEHHVVAAVDALLDHSRTPAQVAAAVTGHARLLRAASTHADFIAAEARLSHARPMPHRNAISAFREALAPWRNAAFGAALNQNDAWHAAGERLAVAHDLLATHIGPDHRLVSLEAEVLTDPDAGETAFRRLAAIVDVATLAAPRLARQARQAKADQVPELTLLESHAIRAANAAAGVLDVLGAHPEGAHTVALQPAPLLRLPEADPVQPLEIAAQAVDVLGRHAIEQARRPVASSVATLHLLTTTGTSLIGHLELLTAARQKQPAPDNSVQLDTDGMALSQVRDAWKQARRLLATYPPLTPAPRLVADTALTAQRAMASLTREGTRWRNPVEIAQDPRLTEHLPALQRVVQRVALLGPHVTRLACQCAEEGLLAARSQHADDHPGRRLRPIDYASRREVAQRLTPERRGRIL